jgi:hypothetical protein
VNKDTEKKDEEKNLSTIASCKINVHSAEIPQTSEAIGRLPDNSYLEDRKQREKPSLPREAIASIEHYAPDLLEVARLNAGRLVVAADGQADAIGVAAWEIRKARHNGQEIREPLELLIHKTKAIARANNAANSPAPPFPDLKAFPVANGPHGHSEADLRRCWEFVWDSWHDLRLCEEFVRHNRRLPMAQWKGSLQAARLSTDTLGSMEYVLEIARRRVEMG